MFNQKEYDKKYQKDNKERIKERKRKYQEKNRERIKEYRKKYREQNKEKIKERHKKYREKNRENIRERNNKMYQKNKEYLKEKGKEYYYKNRENIIKRIKERREKNRPQFLRKIKKYYHKNKEKILKQTKIRYLNHLKSWEGYIPKETNCQICNKPIYFNNGNPLKAINFDHKKEEVMIKGSPSEWLSRHFRTPENQKIWESCKFGMLCGICNRYFPTRNRKKLLENITKYIIVEENGTN